MTTTDIIDFAALLKILGYTDDEFVGLLYQKPGGLPHTAVATPADAVTWAALIPVDADAYFNVSPTRGPARLGERGTEVDVTRLAALWCDLDVKAGGCPSLDVALAIIANLSIILGTRPSAIAHSGHGLHPYWPIEDGHVRDGDLGDARALLARWHRLVELKAAELGAQVDNVFNGDRALRLPGSLNNQDGQSLPASVRLDTGGPLTMEQVDERLTEIGIDEHDGDRDGQREEVSSPASWPWATTTCGYTTKMTAGWATDTPGRGGRNPGLCSQEVRLACAHRYGCITEADYRRSLDVARRRHRELLETTEPRRKLRRLEFADAHKLGLRRAAEKTDEEVRAELGGHPHIGAEGDFWGTGSAADAKVSDEAADPAAGPLCVEHLEADFWDRPSLRTVYDGALALMASPWATLAYCVARALAQVRPGVKLPPLIGGPGSLNWFGAIAAISGGGKGAAHSVAKQLVPGDVTIRNPGSGEGTVQAYVIRGPKGVVDGYRESIMFDAAEVDALASLGARTASTLMPILRQGFSGETLGFAYSDSKKANHIDAHTYRMTLVLAVQPARAGAIFDDAAGGTPQRFMWFPAKDRRATVKTATGYVGSVALPDLGPRADWQKYGRELIVPGGAKELILSEREKSMRDEQDALDEHALFCREKFAFGLAIFDGRTEMTSEDWRLSGIAAEVSTYVRCWVAGKLDEARRGEAAQLGELRGITNQVADDVRAFQASQQANRIAAWILRKLAEVGTEGLTEGRLRDLAANRDRHRIAAILGALAGKNLVKYDADTKKWVVA